MLSLQHATIGYGRNIILGDASFELRPKSICGLVAPNGFGKTTLLRALSGAASLMKHGSVVLDGESVYARQDVRTKLFFGPSDQKRGASPFLQAWGQAAHRCQAIAICKWYNARMEYKSNNNVVCSCRYHVVFCPKCRRPVLVDGVDGRFRQMAEQVAGKLSFDIIEMEAMPGHVHMLLEVDPQLGIHRAVKRIKGRAGHGLRAESPWPRNRIPALWTSSYFVSTVGGAPLAIVRQYIENQKNV